METKKNSEDLIPHDMIFDILTRLPVKSLLRFRCVSILWSSIITEQYFRNLHMTRSLTRPSLLISFPYKSHQEGLLFSSPYPQDAEETSPPLTATHLLSLSRISNNKSYVSESLNGLIMLVDGMDVRFCNPSTRDVIYYFISDYGNYGKFFLGFDPVKNEHKLLTKMIIPRGDAGDYTRTIYNSVFSLGTNSTRRVEDGLPHAPLTGEVSIHGTLYYRGWTRLDDAANRGTIVAFDFVLEKFRLISAPMGSQLFGNEVVLTQFEGRLGVIDYSRLRFDDSMDLWVLEDSYKDVWSKKSFVFPSSWKETVGEREFDIPGIIHGGEIMLAPRSLSKPFYLFYYDMKSNFLRKVEIQGLPDDPDHEFLFGSADFKRMFFSNHVERLFPLNFDTP